MIKFNKTPVQLDNKYAVPACIDETGYKLELDPKGKTTWLTGWGLLNHGMIHDWHIFHLIVKF